MPDPNQKYRDAAVRLFPNVRVDHRAHVSPVEDGAFVEVVVWVPNTAVEPKPEPKEHHESIS